jgi:hypothetical protein
VNESVAYHTGMLAGKQNEVLAAESGTPALNLKGGSRLDTPLPGPVPADSQRPHLRIEAGYCKKRAVPDCDFPRQATVLTTDDKTVVAMIASCQALIVAAEVWRRNRILRPRTATRRSLG